MTSNLARQLLILAAAFNFLIITASFSTGCAQSDPLAPEEQPPTPDPEPDPDPQPDPVPDPDPIDGTVLLEWDAPTRNADGSAPLRDLAGYTLHYGNSSTDLDQQLDTGSWNRADLKLDYGVWYFAVTARDSWGNVSEFSEILKLDLAPPAPQQEPELRAKIEVSTVSPRPGRGGGAQSPPRGGR